MALFVQKKTTPTTRVFAVFHCYTNGAVRLCFVFSLAVVMFSTLRLPLLAQAVAAVADRAPENNSGAADVATEVQPTVEGAASSVDIAVANPVRKPPRTQSRFGLQGRMSTLGVGVDSSFRLARRANLRIGFNDFSHGANYTADSGLRYAAKVKMRSVQMLVDVFPFANGFHLSPGLLLYNGNQVTAKLSVAPGQRFDAEDTVAVSDPKNPITGTATTSLRKIAPAFLFGYGNLLSRKRHIGFTFDAGVVFQGSPGATLNIGGSGCDSSGLHCQKILDDPDVRSEIRDEQQRMNNKLGIVKFYPLVSMGFGYRF